MVIGIVCFAMVATGLVALTIPVPAEMDLDSMAKPIGARILLFSGAGAVGFIGGAWALAMGIKKSRDRKRQGIRTPIRRQIAVALATVTVFVCVVLGLFKFLTRWDPDEEWAAKVIEESKEVRLLLEKYHEENGEFPKSLSDIGEDYTEPTDYLTRNAAAPDTDGWHYNRIGKEDYQLFVTADPWVSHFDAMVYRHSRTFAGPWFSDLDASRSREFGDWRYVRGFSTYHKKYYFDADGNIQSSYP